MSRRSPLLVPRLATFQRPAARRLSLVARPAIVPVVPHIPGTWRLLYFDAPTRGEQIRVLFALSGTPFEDTRLSWPEGLIPYKRAALGNASPLLGTDQCPAVTAPDGTHCVETADIMRFVGCRVGLAPPQGSEAKAMDLCLQSQALLNGVFYQLLRPMLVQRIAATELGGMLWFLRRLFGGKHDPKAVAKLSDALPAIEQAIDGPYLTGEAPCYADVSLFAVLRECLDLDCFDRQATLAPYPKLTKLMADLEDRARPYLEERTARHQHGIERTIHFLAPMFTPFPWSRRKTAK